MNAMGRKKKITLTAEESKPTATAPPVNASPNENGATLSQVIDNTVSEFKAEAEAVQSKRKYSPRKKKEPDTEVDEQKVRFDSLKANFNVLGSFGIDLVCARMPNPIPATDEEKRIAGEVTANLIGKYSDTMNDYGEELAFAFMLLIVFAPRLKKPEPVSTQESLFENRAISA
jgi:hypothetical protein